MSEDHSVTIWINELKNGNSIAGHKLWGRYVQRLARLACRRLGSYGRAVVDEDDVALAVFYAFLSGAEQGRFPELDDRNDLWQILVMLTEKKAIDAHRKMSAAKRGKGQIARASDLGFIEGTDPTPEMAAQSKEMLELLLATLPGQIERDVAIGKLEGKTVSELARDLGLSKRTVDRKLRLIRRKWTDTVNEMKRDTT